MEEAFPYILSLDDLSNSGENMNYNFKNGRAK
jgi:hypothetical protein